MSDIQQKRPNETTENAMARLAMPSAYYCPICHENAINYPDVKFCEVCTAKYIEDVDGGIEKIIELTLPR